MSSPPATDPAPRAAFNPSSAFVTLLSVAQVLLGLLLQIVLSYRFGAGQGMDEYLVAAALPQFLLLVLSPAFALSIPSLHSRWRDEGQAETAAGAGFACVTAGVLGLAGAMVLGAERLVVALAPGLSGHGDPALAAALARVLASTLIAQVLAAYLVALAIARRRFRLWPVAGAVNAAAQVLLTWHFSASLGIAALALGYVVGCLLQLALVAVFLPRRPSGWLRGLRPFGSAVRTMLPVAATRFMTRLTTVSDRWIASWLGAGAIAHVGYGTRVVQAAAIVLSSGLGSTILPDLAELAAQDRKRELARLAREGVRVMSFLTLPVVAVLGLWSAPLVALLLGRGAFLEGDVAQTASFVLFSTGSLACGSIGISIIMALYALREHLRVSVVSALSAMLNLALAYLLSRLLGVGGIALAFSIVALINLLIFTRRLRRLTGENVLRPWRAWHDPNLLALLLLIAFLLSWRPFLTAFGETGPAFVATVLASLGVAGLLYVGTAAASGSRELAQLIEVFLGGRSRGVDHARPAKPPAAR